ncbi:hypothetical protein SAMN04488059_12710 [Devosia psychrophila]|uniref:Uncharacterized protein n=1 Tax=Devosia psychrophila TaxID=728005 RepID=A0A1I1QA51_9HYPH|nr:hypothetical protein SAMN04488059_12710 [Devosia psychrophila]
MTEFTLRDVSNRIVFHRSRFEIDHNSNREAAVGGKVAIRLFTRAASAIAGDALTSTVAFKSP